MLNRRKASIVFIVCLMLIIAFAIASFATNKGIITKEAKLRKTASNDAIVLEIIPKNEEVEVLGTENDWYQVKYNKIKGYVQKDYITIKEDKPTNTTQQNTVTNNTIDITQIKDGDSLVIDSQTRVICTSIN